LVAKSLVVADTTSAGTRYRLLETIRAYALEKLNEAGETDAATQRHAAYFCDLAEKSRRALSLMPTIAWRNEFLGELDNIRAALDWSFGPSGDTNAGIALVADSHPLFDHLSLFDQIRTWLELAKSKLGAATPEAIETKFRCAWALSLLHGGYSPTDEAVAALEQAVELCRESKDENVLLYVLCFLGLARANRFEVAQVENVLAEAVPMMQRYPLARIMCQLLRGMSKAAQGDVPNARQFVADALKHARDSGNLVLQNFCEIVLGMYTLRAGDYALAISQLRDVRDSIQNSPFVDMRRLAAASSLLSLALSEIGKHEEARIFVRETISVARRIGILFAFANLLVLCTTLAGRYDSAARLAGWCNRNVGEGRDDRSRLTRRLLRDRAEAILREKLAAPELERLIAEGAQMTEEEACRIAASE
jgi:tetratricopeptide (TPR) repeat protein